MICGYLLNAQTQGRRTWGNIEEGNEGNHYRKRLSITWSVKAQKMRNEISAKKKPSCYAGHANTQADDDKGVLSLIPGYSGVIPIIEEFKNWANKADQ